MLEREDGVFVRLNLDSLTATAPPGAESSIDWRTASGSPVDVFGTEGDENGVIQAPRATTKVCGCARDDLHRSASRRDLFQLAVGKEGNPAAVRGPHGILGVLSSSELAGSHTIDGSHPQHLLGSRPLHAEHHGMTVGGNSKRWNVDRGVDRA